MKLSAIVALAIAACAVTLYAAKGSSQHRHLHPARKSARRWPRAGRSSAENGLIVLAQRAGAGEVEVQENTNHVFIIVEGEATFVTGGTMVFAEEHRAGADPRGERERGQTIST